MMTTVHIAYGQINYEGRDVIGVFDTPEEALARCRGIERRRATDDDFDCYFHCYWTEAWTVGKTTCDSHEYLTRDLLA